MHAYGQQQPPPRQPRVRNKQSALFHLCAGVATFPRSSRFSHDDVKLECFTPIELESWDPLFLNRDGAKCAVSDLRAALSHICGLKSRQDKTGHSSSSRVEFRLTSVCEWAIGDSLPHRSPSSFAALSEAAQKKRGMRSGDRPLYVSTRNGAGGHKKPPFCSICGAAFSNNSPPFALRSFSAQSLGAPRHPIPFGPTSKLVLCFEGAALYSARQSRKRDMGSSSRNYHVAGALKVDLPLGSCSAAAHLTVAMRVSWETNR